MEGFLFDRYQAWPKVRTYNYLKHLPKFIVNNAKDPSMPVVSNQAFP
jgi:hypothetical protein